MVVEWRRKIWTGATDKLRSKGRKTVGSLCFAHRGVDTRTPSHFGRETGVMSGRAVQVAKALSAPAWSRTRLCSGDSPHVLAVGCQEAPLLEHRGTLRFSPTALLLDPPASYLQASLAPLDACSTLARALPTSGKVTSYQDSRRGRHVPTAPRELSRLRSRPPRIGLKYREPLIRDALTCPRFIFFTFSDSAFGPGPRHILGLKTAILWPQAGPPAAQFPGAGANTHLAAQFEGPYRRQQDPVVEATEKIYPINPEGVYETSSHHP